MKNGLLGSGFSRGHSMIELCVCVALVGILLAQALPSLERIKQRQRLAATAATLFTDLQEARSLAVLHADSIQVRFYLHPNGACYLVHTGATGECQCDGSGLATCANTGRLLKSSWIAKADKLELKTNISALSFQARQGAVTSTGSIELSTSSGESIKQVVSIAGRVRTCSTSIALPQYPRC